MAQAPAKPISGSSQGAAPSVHGAGGAPKILRIGVIQGGKIVEERLVRKRTNVTVGQSNRNSFVIPSEALPKSFLLFELKGSNYALNVSDGMDGRISLGDQVHALAQIKDRGQAQKTPLGWQIPLSDKARGKVIAGDTTILFQFVVPPPVHARPQLPPSVRGSFTQTLDWALIAILGISMVVHFGFVGFLQSVDWPRKPDLEIVPDRFVSMIIKQPPPKVEEKKEEKKEGEGEKKEDKKKAGPPPTERKAGPPKPQKSAEDLAREAAERRAKLAEQVSRMGVLKILGAKGEGGNLENVLRGGDVGGDQDKAFAEIGGVGVAKAGEGVGLRGVKGGQGGTGKTVGIGGLRAGAVGEGGTSAKGPERAVKAIVRADSIPEIDGTLDQGQVSKILKERSGAFKQCYERALKRNPNISGKILLHFTISPVGKVTKVEAEQDTLNDPEVFGCIKQLMSIWHFPAPSGGSAEVTYGPLLFQSAQ